MTTADAPTTAGYDPETTTAPNFLLAAWRRWPWVLIGILIGTAAGFLGLYLARPPVYQSTAQVLVVKNRPDLAGMDSRVALMDDYVATQVTLVKSERILAVAAQKVSPDRVENPGLRALAADADARKPKLLSYLQTQFSVAREKDANAPAGGTNVLNLAVKGANSRDCQYLLEQVIDAYKKELSTIYDAATDSKIKQHTSLMNQFEEQKKDLNATRLKAVDQVSRITPEDVAIIRSRVSKLTDTLRELDAEKRDLNGKLELIKAATADPRARTLILAQISDPGKGQIQAPLTRIDVDNPDAAVRTLEFEKAEAERVYGPDHRLIQGIEAKISFLKELSRKSNEKDPKDPAVPFDALTVHGQVLAFRLKEVEGDYQRAQENLKDDTAKVTQATAIQNTIDESARRIVELDRKIEDNRGLLTQTLVTKGAGGLEATDINKPSLSDDPVAPKLSQALLLGAAGGLLLGLALAALAELADKSFRSPAEIRSRLGLPVIGHIPPIRLGLAADADANAGVEPAVVCATRPKSVEAEAYRGVRTSLYFSLAGRGHQVIQVTSPNPGDGKSTLAANLAVSAAQSGKRVLLIDCDFRRPRQHKIFRLADPGPGFTSVIVGEATLAQAVRRTAVENLAVLPCGVRPANPAELLTSPQFATVLEQAKNEYDYVILDTPPLLAVSDPSVVAPRADGVVLVFRMTSRARPQAERAREQLAQLGANVLGVVVNGAGRATDGYGYGSGAGYHYDYEYEYADYHDEPEEEAAVVPKKG